MPKSNFYKYLHHRFIRKSNKWYPFLSVYYLTNACEFRCPYCCDGHGKPYYQLPTETLPSEKVLKVIEQIRKNSNHLVITGGEPLNHPEFGKIIAKIGEFKFLDVAFTTNGYYVDK